MYEVVLQGSRQTSRPLTILASQKPMAGVRMVGHHLQECPINRVMNPEADGEDERPKLKLHRSTSASSCSLICTRPSYADVSSLLPKLAVSSQLPTEAEVVGRLLRGALPCVGKRVTTTSMGTEAAVVRDDISTTSMS